MEEPAVLDYSGASVLLAYGILMILGGVMAGLAAGKHSELTDMCVDGACPKEAEDPLNSFATFSGMSIGGFIAGGVFAGAGLALVLTAPSGDEAPAADDAPSPEAAPAAKVHIGPSWVGVSGTF